MSKGWRRLVAIFCTLLLAGSVFLFLGMTVWAQEQPQPAEETEEQPADTEQPAETEQPAGTEPATTQQTETTQGQGLTVDYWEPQVGTRTVYYTNDSLNDTHGNTFGTSSVGYVDDFWLYYTSILWIDFSSSYYKSVAALSDMNPVYFDLGGPWYFNMTTPFKYIEEVIGIHEAPDADKFPEATYAVEYLFIGSGGWRIWGTEYRSNDAAEKTWKVWGTSIEFYAPGDRCPFKELYYSRSPIDKKTPIAQTIATFPMSVGTTGSVDAVYIEGGAMNQVTGSAAYEVIAEGELTLPSGTYDALLIEYTWTSPPNGDQYTQIEYVWFVPEIGAAVDAQSLPNIVGPTFGTAVDLAVLEEQTGPGAAQE
jgi:hypothetical protein